MIATSRCTPLPHTLELVYRPLVRICFDYIPAAASTVNPLREQEATSDEHREFFVKSKLAAITNSVVEKPVRYVLNNVLSLSLALTLSLSPYCCLTPTVSFERWLDDSDSARDDEPVW